MPATPTSLIRSIVAPRAPAVRAASSATGTVRGPRAHDGHRPDRGARRHRPHDHKARDRVIGRFRESNRKSVRDVIRDPGNEYRRRRAVE